MKKLFFVSSLFLLLSSCGRHNNNSSSSSGNYLNCKVNGVYWEPDKGGLGEYTLTAKLLFNETFLSINAIKGIQSINLGLLDTLGIKNETFYLTVNAAGSYTSNAQYDNNNATNQYETDTTYTGFAAITQIDKTNLTVEGTFSFTAYNKVLLNSVNVTEGKFKLKYTNH